MSHLGTNRDIFEKEVCLFPSLHSENPQGVFSLPSASFLSHCVVFYRGDIQAVAAECKCNKQLFLEV